MLSGRNNKTEESFIAYYGMSSKEYLALLIQENYGIIQKLDNKVFEGLTKSSTQYMINNDARSLNTRHCEPEREYDAVC
jgi:hypothetical protein